MTSSPGRNISIFASLVSLLFIAALFVVMWWFLQTPAAVPAGAPAQDFASGRALLHVKAISQAPHPTGSAQNREVREYILRSMRALGLDCEEQTTTVVGHGSRRRNLAVAAVVNNVVCRMAGSANSKSVMLATHHDSVPSGPGASDDGSGVATLIETARALRASAPLRNDVIFLFTDAEELGLLGAWGFVEEHRWAKYVGLSVNFEARGTSGPSLMFETSPGNGNLIREVARSVPYPVTSSFFYDFYKRMPNDTDATAFKVAGMPVLNFAYAGGLPRYHTAGDSVQNMDERSLQHHGSSALALTRHFGNMELPQKAADDAIFFCVFGRLLHYPAGWGTALLILVALLFALVLVLGFIRGRLHRRGLILGACGLPVAALISAAVSLLGWALVKSAGLASMLPYGVAYNSGTFAAAFLAFTVAIVSITYLSLRGLADAESLMMGTLLWWLLSAAATGFYFRGAGYVFAWPLLFGLMALASVFASRPGGDLKLAAAWAVPAFAAVMIFGPVPDMLLVFLSTTGLPFLAVAAALLIGFLAPMIFLVTFPARWIVPLGAGAAAVLLVALGAKHIGYDAEHPRASSLFYLYDSDRNEALFVSGDRAPNEWTASFLKGEVRKRNLGEFLPLEAPVIASPAPILSLEPASVSLEGELNTGDVRRLSLRIRPADATRALWISVTKCRVLAAAINEKQLPSVATDIYLTGIRDSGAALTLVTQRSDAPVIRIVQQSDGMPPFASRPRPAHLMLSPTIPFDSSTLVSKSIGVGPR